MHHAQNEVPERCLVKILLSSMEAHPPHRQGEEEEDENGINKYFMYSGCSQIHF